MKNKETLFFSNIVFFIFFLLLNSSSLAMMNPTVGGGKEIEEDPLSGHIPQRKFSKVTETNANASPTKTAQKIELPRKKGQEKQDQDPDRNGSLNHNDPSNENKIFPKKNPKVVYEAFQRLEPFGASRYKGILAELQKKSVYERFKAIDGRIYEQNKTLGQRLAGLIQKEDFQTSTRSGHIFRSQNISPPKDRKHHLQQGDTFDPAMALKELADLHAHFKAEEFTKMKMKEGKQGQLIAKILEKQKINIIRDLDLSLYPLYQQKLILESIEGLEPQELSLRFSPLVTFSFLQKLNFKNIRVLDLRGCEALTDNLLVYLQDKAPELQELNFSRIKNLQRCALKRKGISYPLEFLHLELLCLSGCENLEEIHLNVPSLKQLRANRCGKLKVFEVKAPNLLFLSLLENTNLEEISLNHSLSYMTKLSDLRYEKSKSKVLQALEMKPLFSLWFYYRYPKITDQILHQGGGLEAVDLSDSEINPESFKLLTKELEKYPMLTSLNLMNNRIDDEGAKFLAKYLKDSQTLTYLDLQNNIICTEGALSLKFAKSSRISSKKIKVLLGKNRFKPARIDDIMEQYNNATLNIITKIKLEGSYDEENKDGIKNEGAKYLAEALKGNHTIVKVELTRSGIDDDGAQALAEAFKTNQSIKKIDLSFNRIGAMGVQALAEAFKTNQSITWASLHANKAYKLPGLAEALKINNSLTYLNIGGNSLGETCIEELVEGLKFNRSINILHLPLNYFGQRGGIAIAAALKINNFLHEISLNACRIGDLGVQALAQALKINHSLKKVNLAYNYISAEGAKALAEALATNNSIEEIDLSGNKLGDKGAKVLAKAFKNNSSLNTIKVAFINLGKEGKKAMLELIKLKPSIKIESLDLQKS